MSFDPNTRMDTLTSIHWIVTPVSAIAFYSAIAIPVIYVSLLITGINTTEGLLTFLGLVGLHIFALICGRSYTADE